MHVMLKSYNARGEWSFLHPRNKKIVAHLIKKFSEQYFAKVYSSANLGNPIHMYLQFRSKILYKRFIRALTGILALKITRADKNQKLAQMLSDKADQKTDPKTGQKTNQNPSQNAGQTNDQKFSQKFWTKTPYTRYVFGLTDYLRIKDYIELY